MARTKEERAAIVARLKQIADSVSPESVAGHVLLDHFSARNVVLILAQLPNASACAGYRAWNAAGRQVSKGAKGLAILAPMYYAGESEDNGGEIKGFRVVYVFDVSQTVPLGADVDAEQELSGQELVGV